MRAGRSYLLLPLAAILVLAVLPMLHLRYKPAALEWSLYDPTFFHVLRETPEALGRASCQPDTVLAFGSSPLDTAIARRGEDWRRRGKWRRYDGPLDDTQRILSIVRTRRADLRMFYPVLSQLPDCKKIVALSARTLLPESFIAEGTWQYLKAFLFDSPTYFYGGLVERLWGPPYRVDYSESLGPIIREKRTFNKDVFAGAARARGAFHTPHPAHRDIILELVENGAQIVILDIDRSGEWETALATEQRNFRDALHTFADTHDAIHYRHFAYLDAQYYLDFAHMNLRGAEIFRPWLARETAGIARETNEFQ